MLISGTEPKILKELGKTSSVPERYGVDFLWAGHGGTWGVQRKELKDLVASLHDGRLERELGQMQQLDHSIVVLEGRTVWTEERFLLGVRSFTMDQFYGVQFSVQSQGSWLLRAETLQETARLLTSLEKWSMKQRHGGMRNRPKAQGVWGKADNREWAIHFLQSFPGIGPEVASRIYDTLGIPLEWTCDVGELMSVKGVGASRAELMIGALNGLKGTRESKG